VCSGELLQQRGGQLHLLRFREVPAQLRPQLVHQLHPGQISEQLQPTPQAALTARTGSTSPAPAAARASIALRGSTEVVDLLDIRRALTARWGSTSPAPAAARASIALRGSPEEELAPRRAFTARPERTSPARDAARASVAARGFTRRVVDIRRALTARPGSTSLPMATARASVAAPASTPPRPPPPSARTAAAQMGCVHLAARVHTQPTLMGTARAHAAGAHQRQLRALSTAHTRVATFARQVKPRVMITAIAVVPTRLQ
jgi:hypothetical protein